eukprot:523784-Prorocentrum_minimum.AAC.1
MHRVDAYVTRGKSSSPTPTRTYARSYACVDPYLGVIPVGGHGSGRDCTGVLGSVDSCPGGEKYSLRWSATRRQYDRSSRRLCRTLRYMLSATPPVLHFSTAPRLVFPSPNPRQTQADETGEDDF